MPKQEGAAGPMGKLIYSMIMSLDGYTEDEKGNFGWGAPDDEEVHSLVNEQAASVGTYLYGRQMYETMVYWETPHALPNQPEVVLDWARQWQAADKIVYSRTLAAPSSARTRIEPEFRPDAIRRLKADSPHDLTVDGPELAAHAIKAGLVDEFQMFVCPVVVGGGKRFYPDGVRVDLQLIDERPFPSWVVWLSYAVPRPVTALVFSAEGRPPAEVAQHSGARTVRGRFTDAVSRPP
jgi:dihydrofolate reductase